LVVSYCLVIDFAPVCVHACMRARAGEPARIVLRGFMFASPHACVFTGTSIQSSTTPLHASAVSIQTSVSASPECPCVACVHVLGYLGKTCTSSPQVQHKRNLLISEGVCFHGGCACVQSVRARVCIPVCMFVRLCM
jgi:hypothetical protein